MEPLGLDWIRLGLQDVLYDPKTREVFTPNTGTRQQLNSPAGEPAADRTKRLYWKSEAVITSGMKRAVLPVVAVEAAAEAEATALKMLKMKGFLL